MGPIQGGSIGSSRPGHSQQPRIPLGTVSPAGGHFVHSTSRQPTQTQGSGPQADTEAFPRLALPGYQKAVDERYGTMEDASMDQAEMGMSEDTTPADGEDNYSIPQGLRTFVPLRTSRACDVSRSREYDTSLRHGTDVMFLYLLDRYVNYGKCLVRTL